MTEEEFKKKALATLPKGWHHEKSFPTGEASFRTNGRKAVVALRANPEEDGAAAVISEIIRVAGLRFPETTAHVTMRGSGENAVVFVGSKIAISRILQAPKMPPESAAGFSATCSGPMLRAVAALASAGIPSDGVLLVPAWGGPWVTAAALPEEGRGDA